MQCTKCKKEKTESNFQFRKERKKFNTICIECVNQKRKETRLKNKEKYNETHRNWCKENREKVNKSVCEYQKKNKEKVNKYHRDWYEKNKKKVVERRKELNSYQYNSEKWKEKYKDSNFRQKKIARTALNNCIAYGSIIKSEFCQICGNKSRIEGHHADYSKPLEVIWVCRKCHILIEKNK